jgi:hypothetical protein
MAGKQILITTDEILELYDAHNGNLEEFIRMNVKLNPDENGCLWNNIEFFRNGAWQSGRYTLKFVGERISGGITPLTGEDAAILSKQYKFKTPMASRDAPKYMAPSVQIRKYTEKVKIDPKTGLLEEGATMPTKVSKLFQVFEYLGRVFEKIYTDRVDRKQLVTSIKDRDANPGSQKVQSTKICSVIQYEYGEKHPTLAGKTMLNPVLRITLPFKKDGSAYDKMYYKNDITTAQKAANEDIPKLSKKHTNAVPYTVEVTGPDGQTIKEPLCDRNVHKIPTNSEITMGTIPLSGCASNFGISMPRKFRMVLITESEFHKDSIEDLLGVDSDDEEEKPSANTAESANAASADPNDEPNLEGLGEDD